MSASVCEVIYDGKFKRRPKTVDSGSGSMPSLDAGEFRLRVYKKSQCGQQEAGLSGIYGSLGWRKSASFDLAEIFDRSDARLVSENVISGTSSRLPSLLGRHQALDGSMVDYDTASYRLRTNPGSRADYYCDTSHKMSTATFRNQPIWNRFLNTWITETQKPTTYIHFVHGVELVDRGFYKNKGPGNRIKLTVPKSLVPVTKRNRTPLGPPKRSLDSQVVPKPKRDAVTAKQQESGITQTDMPTNSLVPRQNKKEIPVPAALDSERTLAAKSELEKLKKQRRDHLEKLKGQPLDSGLGTELNNGSDPSSISNKLSSVHLSEFQSRLNIEADADETLVSSHNDVDSRAGESATETSSKSGGTPRTGRTPTAKNKLSVPKTVAFRKNTTHPVSPASDSDDENANNNSTVLPSKVQSSTIRSKQEMLNKTSFNKAPRLPLEKKQKNFVNSGQEAESNIRPTYPAGFRRHGALDDDNEDVTATTKKLTSDIVEIAGDLIQEEPPSVLEEVVETQIGSDRMQHTVDGVDDNPGSRRWGSGVRDTSMQDELRRLMLADERRKAMEMYEKMKRRRRSTNERDGDDSLLLGCDTDWLAKYCVLDSNKISHYRKAFDEVDESRNGHLSCVDTLVALRAVNFLLTRSHVEYMYTVLEIAGFSPSAGTEFQLFTILAALSHRVAAIEGWMKAVIKETDLNALGEKLFKCKTLWECCVDSDSKLLSIDDLCVELRAGGVSYEHELEVRERLGHLGDLDLLDYLTYIPLFIMIHEAVIGDPLSNTRDK